MWHSKTQLPLDVAVAAAAAGGAVAVPGGQGDWGRVAVGEEKVARVGLPDFG